MSSRPDGSIKYELLKKYFGHETFREGQETIIDALTAGRDIVGIMPTGAGKSMCYQIPALILPGITLVISPLISLMHDQVMSLVQSGIKAAYINSMLTPPQYSKVLERMKQGWYKIVYIAPERLSSESFLAACAEIEISLVAVDEAHCVSHWGQDFRPSYLKISAFVSELPKRPPVGAFTATATENVRNDMIRLLELTDPECVTTGFDRPNLFFSVITPGSKTEKLLSLVKERQSLSGIIYCNTRLTVEKTHALLVDNGYSAVRYHAGLDESERRRSQENFVYDRVPIIVATNAFGMGIDKSNVSYIIHYNMPKDIESYYQEAGRAGRDGSEAECILMYSPKDVHTASFFIENAEYSEELSDEEKSQLRLRDEMRLKYMTYYCTTNDCLRSFMLTYFGEKHRGSCGKCSNCLLHYETADITVDAQKIISCIVRMRQSYGVKMICDVLRGANTERIRALGFDKLPTYGIMKEDSESRLRSVINALILKGYLFRAEGEYPVIKLTPSSPRVLKGEETITTKVLKDDKQPRTLSAGYSYDEGLFDRLKALRKRLAERAGIPAYAVFTDATLREICAKRPATASEFISISGVGERKLSLYGSIFMDEIKSFSDENG